MNMLRENALRRVAARLYTVARFSACRPLGRTAMRLYLLAGLILLALALLAVSPAATHAQAGCANPYTVQQGDYLFAIARRFNTNVAVLFALNPGLALHPNLIMPGQVLCLPGQASSVNTLAIVADVTFTYDPRIRNPLTVGPMPTPAVTDRKVSKRVVYPLEQGQVSDVALGSVQLGEKLGAGPEPVLVAVDTRLTPDPAHTGGDYYLVAIGPQHASLLQRLSFLTNTITITTDTAGECNPTPLKQAFGAAVKNVQATIAVEGANGYRHVFGLSDLHVVQNWTHFKQCYNPNRILFALLPLAGGQADKYRLVLLTTDPQNPGGGEGYYEANYYPAPPPWWAYAFRFWW